MNSNILSAEQLIRYVNAVIDEQKLLSDIMVTGEIKENSYRSAMGHMYFSIGSGDANIKCVMFKNALDRVKDFPKKGDSVLVRGTVKIYEYDARLEIVAYDIQKFGRGSKSETLAELKERLYKEGLFSSERKLPVPENPKAVAVITADGSAAMQDIIETFKNHNPLVKLYFYCAVMQGKYAPETIISSLDRIEADGICETAIISRGGGSEEDLSAFNDEKLVRRIAEAKIPIISAVGHEINFTLCDLAADRRAATPTAACYAAAAPIEDTLDEVKELFGAIQAETAFKLRKELSRLDLLNAKLMQYSPKSRLEAKKLTVAMLGRNVETAAASVLRRYEIKLEAVTDKISLLNPLNKLKKEYALTFAGDRRINSAKDVKCGDTLTSEFTDGTVKSVVTEVIGREAL